MNRKTMWTRAAAVAAGGGLALSLVAMQTGSAAAGPAALAAQGSSGASNPYSPAYGHPYRHGVVPTRGEQAKMDAYAASHAHTTSSSPETLAYGGGVDGVGVTDGTPQVYLVFWGSGWGAESTDASGDMTFTNDPDSGAPYIQDLFKGLGTAPTGGSPELWSGTMTQYCDGSVAYGSTTCPSNASFVGYPTGGGVLAGVWYDDTSVPTTTTAAQIADEAARAAAHFGAAGNRYAQFDILSPHGANPDNYLNSNFCAWHDYTGDGYSLASPYVAFTNMPYVMDVGASCGAGFVTGSVLDGYSIVNGHEYAETLTDQFPAGGWTNLQHNTYSGEEVGDECAWISPSSPGGAGTIAMSTGIFAMQSIWSNDTNSCTLTHPVVGGSSGGGDTVTVNNPGNQLGYLRTAVSLQMSATDSASGQTFTWSASGLPPGLSIVTGSGKITGTPTHTGNYTSTVTATDTTGATGSTSFTWTIKR
jgi:hypothetical protein